MKKLKAAAVMAAALAVPAMAGSPARAATVPAPVVLSGLDLHDGTIVAYGGTYYAYGTEYGCGFQWTVSTTPWCGFAVRTAKSLSGPWSAPRLLFNPGSGVRNSGWNKDYWRNWQQVCRGGGCFNPRMIRRGDGVWILWFNAPEDYFRYHANAYWAMGCNGPAGPCGAGVGGHGTTHKPNLWKCADDGDFSVVTPPGQRPVLVCAMGSVSTEELSAGEVDGDAAGVKNAVPPGAEGQGAYWDGTQWVMTYSSPGCGYCSGKASAGGATSVHAGYATATSLLGTWTQRGYLSATACAGQPRTVFSDASGQAWEWIDRWTGSRNETTASVKLEPMAAAPWSCT